MIPSPVEHRALVEPVEFRAEGTRLRASGVAMRYGARSKPIGGQFREVFSPGSFAKTIREQDIKAHHEHGGPYLGRSGAGTLRLHDDRSALAYELDLPDTTAGRDAAVLLERGDIKGSSIGFRAIPAAVKWSVDDDGMALRSVSEAQLLFVDLTTSPAYDDSTAELALRSLAEELHTDVRALLDATDLPTVIKGTESETVEIDEPDADGDEGGDDDRETPIVIHRRPMHWFV